MEPQDPSDNVYSLFPGTDTAPFGGGAGTPPDHHESTDDGWSATPERTIVDAGDLGRDAGRRNHLRPFRRRPPGPTVPRPLRLTALGLAVGAAVAASLASLSSQAPQHARKLAAAAVQSPSVSVAAPNRSSRAGHKIARHRIVRARRSKAQRSTKRSHPAIVPVKYTPPAQDSAPTPPAITSASTVSGGSDGNGAGTSQAVASQAAGQQAGPTGPGALTGAGSTPSG